MLSPGMTAWITWSRRGKPVLGALRAVLATPTPSPAEVRSDLERPRSSFRLRSCPSEESIRSDNPSRGLSFEVLHVPRNERFCGVPICFPRQHGIAKGHAPGQIAGDVVCPRAQPGGRGVATAAKRVEDADGVGGGEIIHPPLRGA